MECKTCKFYNERKCKRYPPVKIENRGYEFSAYGEFLTMKENDWCGEYQKDMKNNSRPMSKHPCLNTDAVTEDESEIINLLGIVWNKFLKLSIIHPQDRQEFLLYIHQAQNIILSRGALRSMQSVDNDKK